MSIKLRAEVQSAFSVILTLCFCMVSDAIAGDINRNVDWAQFLSRSDMYWDVMPTSWSNGPFIGNGMLGTIFWQEGSTLHFEINRSDQYDHRNKNYSVLNGRCRLPNGYFSLGYVGAPAAGGNMRLDLWNAEVRGTITTSAGNMAMRTFTHATNNVIVLEITAVGGESGWTLKWNPRVCQTSRNNSTDPKPADYLAYPAQTQDTVNGVQVSTQSMPEDAKYNTAGRGEGQFATAWKIVDNGGGKKTVYMSEESSYPGTTARQKAIDAVNNAASAGVDAAVSSHQAWWHNYYPKSFLSFPYAKAESFYWIQLYKMGSATRGNGPVMDLMGPWYDISGWPGTWWNLNTQLQYWPFFVSNHADEGSALINNLDKYKNNLADNAGTYSSDSYAIFRGSGNDLSTEWFPSEAGNLAFALNDVWQQYRCTMDDDMLRNKLFPLLKGAFKYLSHRSTVGTDGKIHIDQTYSPEYPLTPSLVGNSYTANINDCNYTLSLFKWLSRAIIYANDRLNLNDPVRSQCQNVIDSLVAYPANSNGFMVGSNMPFAMSHRHWSHMFMVYPLLEYTYDDTAQAALVDKSIKYWQLNSGSFRGYSWVVGTSFAAMKGDGATALYYLDKFFTQSTYPILKNTLYREGDPVIETPLFCTRSIQDMVLMSYNNIIRVFPGVPNEWADISFDKFRAEGAFYVSAKRQGGVTKFIRIESLAGEPCNVKTGMTGTVKASGNRTFTVNDLGHGIVQVDLQKNEYAILYTDTTLPDLSISPVSLLDRANYWGVNSAAPTNINQQDVRPINFDIRNYPNPFNPSTEIQYSLSQAGHVKLVIYDIVGREVETLINEYQQVGSYECAWNASNARGKQVASGTYLARITAGEYSRTIKLLLCK